MRLRYEDVCQQLQMLEAKNDEPGVLVAALEASKEQLEQQPLGWPMQSRSQPKLDSCSCPWEST